MAVKGGTNLKRARILEAARELFLRDGFGATSMDAVTARAGVSKATVYAHFAGKEELFACLVRETAASVLDGLPPLQPAGDVEAELVRYLRELRRAGFSEGLRWHRLAIAEATRHPEISRLMSENGAARVRTALGDFLGRAGCPEPAQAAEHLIAVTLLAPMHLLLLGIIDPATARADGALLNDIRAVLRAYPPRRRQDGGGYHD